jgi:sterol 14-demethylase
MSRTSLTAPHCAHLHAQVIQSRRSSPHKEEDVLQQFCDARYQNVYNGRQLTEEEIAGLLIAVLFAGQHTSSITSSWTGYFMINDKVRGTWVCGGQEG